MTKRLTIRKFGDEEGSALYATLVTAVVVVGMSVAMATTSLNTKKEYEEAHLNLQRYYAAEAGIAHSLADMKQGGNGIVGTPGNPIRMGAASYWVGMSPQAGGNRLFDLKAFATAGGHTRSIEGVVREDVPGVFHHAMFAGNSSGDPNYSLDLGGTGGSADSIEGDVFSGGDISISGDAAVTGSISATGTITGASGDQGITQPLPDLAGMNYETAADVDVAAEFASSESYGTSSEYGGDAWEVPNGSPGHIFRKNPSDRESEWSATAKDDYFLEDSHETLDSSNSSATGSGTPISISPPLNEAVYYIDGNLWIHNRHAFTFRLESIDASGQHPTRLTIAVKGNIYISDNIVLDDPANDGIALIAMKDSGVTDSGNIYFGDSLFGTLERMDAFMYAENDFIDRNLSGGGTVQVNGLMSAGNHVDIDHGTGDSRTALELNFDPRISDGDIQIPGVPANVGTGGGGSSTFTLVWAMEDGADDYNEQAPQD